MHYTARLTLLLLVAAGCAGNPERPVAPREKPPEPLPPVAEVVADPTVGAAPLFVTLDASGSADPNSPGGALAFRWDFDGDGVWDTDFADASTDTFTYLIAGTFVASVEVRASNELTSVAEVTLEVEAPPSPFANLDADSNRDGVITAADDAIESIFDATAGAIVLANQDDDNRDGERDWRDDRVNGDQDALDLSPVVLRFTAPAPLEYRWRLSVTPLEAAERVRVFWNDGGAYSELIAPGAGSREFFGNALDGGDIALAVESTSGRTRSWDGHFTLTLVLEDGGGQELSRDAVVMRAAPTILPDNTRMAEVLYVMRITAGGSPNLPFFDALYDNLPEEVELYRINAWDYGADRWAQDNMQAGYQSRPTAGGLHINRIYLQTERETGWFGLEPFLPYELLRGDLGFVYPGGDATSHNYGGNLEIAPPHDGFPLGRLMVGGGDTGTLGGRSRSDRMTSRQRDWLDAQEAQGPAIEVSTEWLAVGHVDEVFLFISDPNSTTGKPYKVVLASPDLARRLLADLSAAGGGNTTVFAGRTYETSVASILGDLPLMAYNDAAQIRIDTVREELSAGVGLDDGDFIEVPVMYEPHYYQGIDMAAAYNPGIQNLVAAGDTLFIPDPEGPNDGAGDVFKREVEGAMATTGHTIVWVDVFESYHLLLGEAHCGTNVQRAPYDLDWWSQP